MAMQTVKMTFLSEYFDPLSTLDCGQIFRFSPFDKGFLVVSKDKCAYLYKDNDLSIIECEEKDKGYFYNFFDLDRDYKAIFDMAKAQNVEILTKSANVGKGIRILNQDKQETLFSFIISQNNNIPRIKNIIEKLCLNLGEKRAFKGREYYTFPTAQKMAEMAEEFYLGLSLGYRAKYIKSLADNVANGLNVDEFDKLDTEQLKLKLQSLLGVGPKVADCVALFGYHRSDSFPVDTWIEKVYKEDFLGNIKDRKKIAEYFVKTFKDNAGYYQQYLFYYKRSMEKQELNKK